MLTISFVKVNSLLTKQSNFFAVSKLYVIIVYMLDTVYFLYVIYLFIYLFSLRRT